MHQCNKSKGMLYTVNLSPLHIYKTLFLLTFKTICVQKSLLLIWLRDYSLLKVKHTYVKFRFENKVKAIEN